MESTAPNSFICLFNNPSELLYGWGTVLKAGGIAANVSENRDGDYILNKGDRKIYRM